nr:hypothetical protein B0A51_16073 [Rachicladosporium sp. CCFEE 5018]
MANLTFMTPQQSFAHMSQASSPQHGMPAPYSQSFSTPYDHVNTHAHPSQQQQPAQRQMQYSQSFPNGPVSNPGYARSFGQGYENGRGYGGKPQIYTAVYSGVNVYEMDIQGVACMRRRNDGWLNATQILKVAGVDKGKRTKVLEKEILPGEHEKVQGGYGKYQGTWISYRRGREFCRQYGVEDILKPLLDYDVSSDGSGGQGQETPTKEQAMAANRKRYYNQVDAVPNGGPATNGTFFSNISPSTSVALAAMSKAARLNSPMSRPASVQKPYYTQPSQQDGMQMGSQQSMASQGSFDGEGKYDSGYSTHPNGEPPRKRMRGDSNGGAMPPPSLPLDISMRSATPTEPNESFLYDATMTRDFMEGERDAALPPLPTPSNKEQTEKMNLILGLFAESGRTDYSSHPAIQQLSGEDFNIPLDASANNALHWAATLAKMPLLKLLISRGANIWRGNVSGQSPLISAVIVSNCWERTCFPDLLELLSPLIEVRDHAGRTVLHHIAVSSGIKGRAPSSKYYLEALLEFLVRIGTAPGAPGTAPTAPMMSQKSTTDPQLTNGDSSSQDSILSNAKGAVNLVRFLSHIVNARDKAGNTALNLVARIGNRSIIQQLLEIHADPGLANNKGVSAKDFGVGSDGGLLNGLASQQSTQAMPDTQEEDTGEGAAQVSQTEDLSQDVITSMTTLLTSNMTTHRDLLTQRTEAIDRLNAQIREFSAIQTTELERLRETQSRVKARGERQARLANLNRFKISKPQASLSQATALGDADTAILPADLIAILPNADAAFSPQLATALPSTAFLRQNIQVYHNNNALLQRQDAELRSRSLELEGLYRKVVSLCTDVEEGRVEEALPSLVQAVESERGGMRGEGEVGRVREFLRRVDGRVEG